MGGVRIGAARAGFNVASGVDFDARALAAHAVNFPESRHLHLDLSKTASSEILDLSGLKAGELDVIVGGPPCQGFSSMGRRDLGDVRNQLIHHFFRIVSDLKPKAFLMENVPGVLNPNYAPLLEAGIDMVRREYTVLDPYKLRAVEAGAPTIRKRVLIVGFRHGYDASASDFWNQIELKRKIAPTVRHALDGLPFDVSPDPKSMRNRFRKVSVSRIGEFFEKATGAIPQNVGDRQIVDSYQRRNFIFNKGS